MIFIDKGIEEIIQFDESDTELEKLIIEHAIALLVCMLKRFREVQDDGGI